MNQIDIHILKILRKVFGTAFPQEQCERSLLPLSFSGQKASDFIKKRLLDDRPCMISRFGSTELIALVRYVSIIRSPNFLLDKSIAYVMRGAEPFWWDKNIKLLMNRYSGFFPATDEMLGAFGNRMIADMKNIDVLGSWLEEEVEFSEFIEHACKVKLQDLEPYYHSDPWSEALAGRKVLVIHPFEESIVQQYKKRELLFQDKRILPKFELKTLKAVQSLNESSVEFKNWFEALDWMCEKINNIEFDVAIIGAGAYGLPLSSYVKSIGKKSVHMGGSTQVLFGIKGKRWDDRSFFKQLYNQHWVRPLASEVPNDHQSVEGGCYW